jgi:hypothetical protein
VKAGGTYSYRWLYRLHKCVKFTIQTHVLVCTNIRLYIAHVRCLYFNEVACNTIPEHVSKTGSIFVKQTTVNTGSWQTCCLRHTRQNAEKPMAPLRVLTSSNCVRSASNLYETKLTRDLSATHLMSLVCISPSCTQILVCAMNSKKTKLSKRPE